MPVIGIPVDDLGQRIGEKIDRERLLEVLGDLGCDVEGYATLRRAQCTSCGYVMELVGKEDVPPLCDRCGVDLKTSDDAVAEMSPLDVVRMELLAVRPDMFDPAGLARAIRGVLGVETGLPVYSAADPAVMVRIDDSVRRPTSLRPHIACAVLEDVEFDDDSIKILMKLQENLHWALGRNRKHASIGVYDLDSLGGETELEYLTEDPDAYGFIPLGSTASTPEGNTSLRRILAEHPKGRAYANLLKGFDRYPILRTRSGQVLSMPPIINSDETKVHKGSRRLFIDVTGTGWRIVSRTLNILITSLIDYHPSIRLSSVELLGATPTEGEGDPGTLRSPDLTPQDVTIDPERTARLLGIPCDSDSLEKLLLRMRHGVGPAEKGRLLIQVPAYRNDILHERDLMEDAAIAFGYGNIPRTLVPTMTVGKDLEKTRRGEELRDVMTGLGFLEIMSLTLTCPEQSDGLLGLPDHPDTAVIDNPISSEQTQLRTSLLPGILQTFARNRHNALPQEVFEIGEVTLLDPGKETGAAEQFHLGFGVIAPKIGFAEGRAWVETLTREIGWGLHLQKAEFPFLIAGRTAMIATPSGEIAGLFGEVHPVTLERLGLQNPVLLCEIVVPHGTGPVLYPLRPEKN